MSKPPPHPTIRRASTTDDWRAAATLLHDYVEWLRTETGLEPFIEQPSMEAELADLREAYSGPHRSLFMAWSRDRAVGIVGLSYHPDRSAELTRLFVRPSARRSGIADRLVHHAILKASARGCDEIWLETLRHAMDPAIRLYARNGFERQTSRARTIAHDDIVGMSRQLRALHQPAAARTPDDSVLADLVTRRSSTRPARSA